MTLLAGVVRDQSCGTDNGQFRLAPSDSVMKCVGFAGSFTAIATVSGQLAHHSSKLYEGCEKLDVIVATEGVIEPFFV